MNVNSQVNIILDRLHNAKHCMMVFIHNDRLRATPRHRQRAEKIAEHNYDAIIGYYNLMIPSETLEDDVNWYLKKADPKPSSVPLWGLT